MVKAENKYSIEKIKKLTAKTDYFLYGGNEWRVKLDSDKQIEKLCGKEILVFADNGFGDYLFLFKENDSCLMIVHHFFHEKNLLTELSDSFEELLELKLTELSNDNYPQVVYKNGGKIYPGDKVKFKIWFFFRKGCQDGVVTYAPGISPQRNEYEYNGIKKITAMLRSALLSITKQEWRI